MTEHANEHQDLIEAYEATMEYWKAKITNAADDARHQAAQNMHEAIKRREVAKIEIEKLQAQRELELVRAQTAEAKANWPPPSYDKKLLLAVTYLGLTLVFLSVALVSVSYAFLFAR